MGAGCCSCAALATAIFRFSMESFFLTSTVSFRGLIVGSGDTSVMVWDLVPDVGKGTGMVSRNGSNLRKCVLHPIQMTFDLNIPPI